MVQEIECEITNVLDAATALVQVLGEIKESIDETNTKLDEIKTELEGQE